MSPSNSMNQSPLARYWALIRKTERELTESHPDGIVHIATLGNELAYPPVAPGTVSVSTPYTASICLTPCNAAPTHRLATPEEIAAFEKMHAERAAVMNAQARGAAHGKTRFI